DIKAIVVDDKWFAAGDPPIQSEMEPVSRMLTSRIKTLADRYATPLPVLTCEVAQLSTLVDEHLRKMISAC
ncbi:hypothetical protein ABTH46_19915, partial [Acinetobacter baumannii]